MPIKYEFIGDSRPHTDPDGRECLIRQIRYLRDGRHHATGEVGGWLESGTNLSLEGTCSVLQNAIVSGDAIIDGSASVRGTAQVFGNARVRASATVRGEARVYGYAIVRGSAEVRENGIVRGDAIIMDHGVVLRDAVVEGTARVENVCSLYNSSVDAGIWQWSRQGVPADTDPDEEEERDEDEEESQDDTPRMELLNYSANPFDHFPWHPANKPNALVFGVELEMEPLPGRRSSQLIEALGGSVGNNFILKSDGSLNDGVELVTMPFTLEQHRKGLGVDWKTVLASVADKAMSGLGTDRCGIHIHINKKALSALTIGKMLVFLNSPNLAQLVTQIAQRSSSSYCQRDTKKKITDGIAGKSANRYDIMNVSVRHPTCELRMFKGNLAYERVIKNIEFCHALVQYCRASSAAELADWGMFTRWLVNNRGMYPHLVQFLIDKNTAGIRQLYKIRKDNNITISDI